MTKLDLEQESNRPPIFKSWRRIYLLVIGWLGALILFFQLFTVYYRP